jgi:hypothetical protein
LDATASRRAFQTFLREFVVIARQYGPFWVAARLKPAVKSDE